MRLSRLTAAEMLALSTPWITPGSAAHTALSAQPELTSLLRRLRTVHDKLLGRQAVIDPRLGQLAKQLQALDEEHDTLARGLDAALLALSLLAADEPTREQWERLRQTLFPAGLGIINQTYAAEAGNAMLLEKRIEGLPAADKKALKGQSLHGHSLTDLIARFVAAGIEIGRRENERQSLEPRGASPGELHAARLDWVRTVAAILALIELGSETGGEELQLHVVAPLRAADLRAARRKAGRGSEPEDEDPPAPAGG
jgi:hypothetical protein